MRVPKWLRISVGLLLIAGLSIGVWRLWATTPTAGAPGQEGWVSTKWGPLGPADRDLLIKVRLAGLWEHPVGQELQDRATQPRVREVGQMISEEHQELDRIVVAVSRDLGVQLPNQPSEQQQGWMTEITSQAGVDYDRTAINLLRQAHGGVYPVIANLRAGSRNDRVRQFAAEAETFVSRHMGYLESTGLVEFDELPEPPTPARAVVTPSGTYEDLPLKTAAALALVTLGAGVLFLLPMIRGGIRRRSRPRGRHARKGRA